MSVFSEVKERISVREAAELYGFRPNRSGLIVCPFHKEKTASCKVDHRFHCFSCGADGDVIDFVSRLYGLKPMDSAKKLATDFGIMAGSEPRASPSSVMKRLSEATQHKSDANHCLNDLVAYRSKLRGWEKMYAPKSPEDELHPCFVDAMQRKDYIDYLIDVMVDGADEDRQAVVKAWKGGEIRGVNDSRGSKEPA